jgi:O-methyltransferase involved in polyketide biosynthesis
MNETASRNLNDVEKTLLIPLYIRALESQRPGGLIKDERAEALVRRLDSESLRKTAALTEDTGRAVIILKGREIDRIARDFMARRPNAAVVHIGCGLDTRFERVDDGRVEWYDLDLPDVIALRRKLVGGEVARRQYLACSVLESGWMETVGAKGKRPFLFLAEGVFIYFEEAQVKSLVLALRERFPGAELAFDDFSPFQVRIHNNKVDRTGIGAHLHWALKNGRDLERWGPSAPLRASPSALRQSEGIRASPSTSLGASGIRLLEEFFPFQYPDPRIRRFPIVLLLPLLAKAVGVFHYQL